MLDKSKHLALLQDLLRKIYRNRHLAPRLGFKGGTALMLFYGLDRFSTDLDFDLLSDDIDSGHINQILRQFSNEIGNIKEAESSDGKKYIRIIISYANDLTRNIKLDISKRNFGSSYELKNLLGLDMRVMVKEDIFAHKLVATTDRVNQTNRDLYDLYFMFKSGWVFNEEILRSRLGKAGSEYLPELIDHVRKVDSKHILSGLGDLLDSSQKQWVKDHLLVELVYKLEQFLLNNS